MPRRDCPCDIKIAIEIDFLLVGHVNENEKKIILQTIATPSRNVSFRLLHFFLAFMAVSGAFLLRKAAQTTMLTGKHSESLYSCEMNSSWMDFFAVSFVVGMKGYNDV